MTRIHSMISRAKLLGLALLGFASLANASLLQYDYIPLSYMAQHIVGGDYKLGLYEIPLTEVNLYLPSSYELAREQYKMMAKRYSPLKVALKALRQTIYPGFKKHREMESKEFLDKLVSNNPYTYVITDDYMRFVETTQNVQEERSKDIMTKHFLISGMAKRARYAGQMWVKKNANNDIFLVLDNGSGTYRPCANELGKVRQLLEKNLGIASMMVERGRYPKPAQKFYINVRTKNYSQTIDYDKLYNYHESPFNEQQL